MHGMTVTSLDGAVTSLDVDELHVEMQRRVGRDDAGVAACAVRIVRRADQLGALPFRHLHDTLVPAAYDLILANVKGEGTAAVSRRVELLSVVQRACIMNIHFLSSLRECDTIARCNGLNFNTHAFSKLGRPGKSVLTMLNSYAYACLDE